MAFTSTEKKRIDYFRRSVRLDSEATASDPAYNFSDEELLNILEVSAPSHLGKTLNETGDKDFSFVLLLAKKEIYYRLATTTAPFYPLEAEGAKLEKNVRFDHYIKLIQVVQEEYESSYDKMYGSGALSAELGTVKTYQSRVYGKPYLHRYAQLADNIPIELTLSGITSNSVNLDWTKFDTTFGANFAGYEVFVSEEMIYDEYSINPQAISIKPLYRIENVRKVKVRITDLDPGKTYYVLVRVKASTGEEGFAQEVFETDNVPLAENSASLNDEEPGELLIGGE